MTTLIIEYYNKNYQEKVLEAGPDSFTAAKQKSIDLAVKDYINSVVIHEIEIKNSWNVITNMTATIENRK